MALCEHKNELPGHVDFKELLETLSNLVEKVRDRYLCNLIDQW